jgi:hypothetical protein
MTIHAPVTTAYKNTKSVNVSEREKSYYHDTTYSDPSSNAPIAVLLTIHIDQCGYQPRKRVQTTREEDAVQEPHIVRTPPKPQPEHTQSADTRAKCRDV